MELVKINGPGSGAQMSSELDPFDPAQFRIDPNAENAIGVQKVTWSLPFVPPGER
jgi:hypothetical protein